MDFSEASNLTGVQRIENALGVLSRTVARTLQEGTFSVAVTADGDYGSINIMAHGDTASGMIPMGLGAHRCVDRDLDTRGGAHTYEVWESLCDGVRVSINLGWVVSERHPSARARRWRVEHGVS